MLKYILATFLLFNLGLCQSVESNNDQLTTGPVCEVCTIVLGAAKTLLEQNKTADEVLHFIEKDFCGKLGSLNATCVQYLEQYGASVIMALANDIDPTLICNKIGVCQTAEVVHPIIPPMIPGDSLNCTLCKLVFTQVQNMLKNNASEQQLLQLIEKTLCNATGAFSAECKTLIDTYGPTILTYLANGMDPTKLCVIIGMCSKRNPAKLDYLINHSKFSVKAQLEMEIEASVLSKGKAQKLERKDQVYCTVCQYAMQFLDVELKKNSSEQAMLHALEGACKVAPESTQNHCINLISTYGIYLIELLIQFADPLKVCELIKLC